MGAAAEKLDPALVSPVVAFLVHEDCPVTGRIFSAAGGRVGEVFIGACQGLFDANLTVEAVRDGFDKICDRTDYAVPTNANEEMALVFPHLM